MRAVRVHEQGDVRYEEVDGPGRPGPSQVVVAPLWCGLCGTDVKEYVVGMAATVPSEPHPLTGACRPQILGHEFVGRVVEVGSDVTHVSTGDKVIAMPLLHCGTCSFCARGDHILCPNKAWVGLSTRWGGLGDRALIEAFQATPLGSLTDEQGALVEPAAVSLNAVLRAGMTPGDRVLVIGAGPVGALALLAAIGSGAAAVYVVEPNPNRATIATRLGADRIINGDAGAAHQQVLDLTDGVGVDVAIDCAGKAGTLSLCIGALKPDGVVSVPSVHKGAGEVDVRTITRRPVTVRGSLGYAAGVWERTIAMIAAGRYPVERIVTSRITRDRIIEDGFDALVDETRGELKILVEVS